MNFHRSLYLMPSVRNEETKSRQIITVRNREREETYKSRAHSKGIKHSFKTFKSQKDQSGK